MKRVRVRGQVAHLDWAESDSEPNAEYEIARHPDGTLRCACMAFVFNRSRPKTCKHLAAYRLGTTVGEQVLAAEVRGQRAQVSARRVQVGTETFSFRGISFTDELGVAR